MNRFHLKLFGILFFVLIMIGCRADVAEDEMNGRITLWHRWSPAEAAVLEKSLAQFQEIHPEVLIIPVAMPEDQILDEFYRLGNNGLGPSVLIGDDIWIGELADAGLIQPLRQDQDPDTLVFFNTRNRSLVTYQDELFGMPALLAPYALYYNKDMVEEPPESLEALLSEAEADNQVAFVPRFEEAYWGIQGFGDGLFDSEDRFTLAESGFTEWLRWLNDAQTAPGVILNVDDESLLELFATGQIAYYVGDPDKQLAISALDDPENPIDFGVVPLPQGLVGDAGPLLAAEVIMLYAYMSDEQVTIANELAKFLVNNQQSIRYMRELDRVPANSQVRVDRRIYPIVNGFARQARTAVVIPNEILTDPFVEAGNRAYITVLSGASSPEEAVCAFGLEVAAFQGYSDTDMSLPEDCAPLSDASSEVGH